MYFHGTYRFTVCCIFPIEWKTSLLPSSMIRFRSDLRPGFFQNSDIFVGGFTEWVFSLSGDRSVCQNSRSIQGSNIERLGLQNQCTMWLSFTKISRRELFSFAPIFLRSNYFRQNIWGLSSAQFHF